MSNKMTNLLIEAAPDKGYGFKRALQRSIILIKTIEGRATRAEYWWFTLINTILIGLAYYALYLFNQYLGNSLIFTIIMGIVILSLFLSKFPISIRRLHDRNHTGWFVLLELIPIGFIILCIQFCMNGTKGENRFGADPFRNKVKA